MCQDGGQDLGRATRLSPHLLTPGLANCPGEKLTSSSFGMWPQLQLGLNSGQGLLKWLMRVGIQVPRRQRRQALIFPLQAVPLGALTPCNSHFPSPRLGNWESAPPLSCPLTLRHSFYRLGRREGGKNSWAEGVNQHMQRPGGCKECGG